jgi:hypothetical protein
MKRSIIIIAVVVAAIGIIPLVAQTTNSKSCCPKAAVCEKGQDECQGQGCKEKCEEGKKCETCPKKASGECEGCEKKCEECPKAGECKKACNIQEDVVEEAPKGCGSGGGCGMGMGGCGQN